MKRVILILLLAATVLAQEPIPRYSDFPLDNIHILRLQAASSAIAQNVSMMGQRLESFQQMQNNELQAIRNSLDDYKRTDSTRLLAIEDKLSQIEKRIDMITAPEIEMPAPQYPKGMFLLLSLNILLLFIVILLIIYLKGRYSAHTKFKAELSEHIHPAPSELIDYVKKQLKRNKKLTDIRIDLADKGWSPSIIEHAIHAAKER